jgi:sugar lactone lactonase YvrE
MDIPPQPGWLALLLAASTSVHSLSAQIPAPLAVPPGHQSRVTYVEPASAFDLHGFAVDPRSEAIYVASRDRVIRRDRHGGETLVHQLGQGDATLMFAAPAGTGTLVFQSLKTDTLFILDFATGDLRSLPGLKNSYDVVATQSGQLLVVANPDWPRSGANSGVYAIDLVTARHREVIRLTGPSGPLLLTSTGDLIYAVQSATFPTPRGAIWLSRFTAAQVQAALAATTPLPLSAGQVVLSGLDGAADLAYDDRGRLWITDPQRGGIVRTRPGGWTLETAAFVAASRLATLGLQFVDGGPATMDAFQPAAGGTMFVSTSDWSSAEVRRIEAQRPGLLATQNPVPPGRFRLTVDAAPAHGAVLLGFSALPLVASRPVFEVGGLAAFFALDFLVPPLLLGSTTDAAGVAAFDLNNPGGAALTFHLQALITTPTAPAATPFGTTDPLTLEIRR